MDWERLIDEILMLLPGLERGLGRPGPEELGELAGRGVPVDAPLSPGHVQVLISLGKGPHSVRRLAGALGGLVPGGDPDRQLPGGARDGRAPPRPGRPAGRARGLRTGDAGRSAPHDGEPRTVALGGHGVFDRRGGPGVLE